MYSSSRSRPRPVLAETAIRGGRCRKRKQRQGIEYYSELRALEAAERADIGLVLIDATEGIVDQDLAVADMTAFFSVRVDEEHDRRTGILVEYDLTSKIFTTPSDQRTEDYVTGRFG